MTQQVLHNFINGDFVAAATDQTMEIISPLTEEVVAISPLSGSTDVDAAYAAAEAAATTWKKTTPSERQLLLLRIADAIEDQAAELAATQHRETGQPLQMVIDEEVLVGANQLRFFAGAARTQMGLSSGEYLDGYTSTLRREPIGVVGQVVPWNYPLLMMIWKVGPALAAGNTVVLKPSETTPSSALHFAELTKSILPPGVLNIVLGDSNTGSLLVSHPVPGLVAITGSVRAGIAVAQAAAGNVTRAHLELGGKAPAIVFADADIADAAEGIAAGGLFNAGQDCTAVTRVLVHEDAASTLLDHLLNEIKKLLPGEFYGPLNNARHLERVESILDRLPDHATIVTGGKRASGPGFYFEPTVITGVRQDDEVVQTELFAPILTIQTFRSDDEALELANDIEYALASSVWTSDHKRSQRFARDLNFGCVWVNTHIALVAEMPHGGFKHSGYGKDLSLYGVEDYTRLKHVMSIH